MIPTDVETRRQVLRRDPNCRFVSWSEFCELLLSRSPMQRSDDPEASVYGLVIQSNNCRYLVECEKTVPPSPH